MYQCVSLPLLHSFFDWLLNRKSGKRGRRLRGTKLKSSLGTYWKVYRLVYERATGQKIHGQVNRGMHKVGNISVRSKLVRTERYAANNYVLGA